MNDAAGISDALERRTALDPARSFIVQAPAGSGKTELLTQRYLALLARVKLPEEVVAITFTNKAAQEMRSRVVQALQKAHAACPDKPHERVTWELARAVVEHDRQMGWDIEVNPVRLRVQTIDALCQSLTRQMPLLSRFGAQPAIADDPGRLYREAARNTLAELETGRHWSPAVEHLLGHLDNNLLLVEGLLSVMLARRDQWLRHVVGAGSTRIDRASLELALGNAVSDTLQQLAGSVPADLCDELLALARYAAANLRADGAPTEACVCLDVTSMPGTAPAATVAWCALAALLLTNEGDWRKTITIKNGFPAPGAGRDAAEKARFKEMKERMLLLLGRLAVLDDMRVQLHAVRSLPPAAYSDAQWEILQALVALLPVAVAQLRLVFQEHGQVDFTEVSQAALRALGEPDNPTDLALALDHRLQHLLVDEFQDTSFSQYDLLERLTAGWSEGDGRTLFAVGDPMQSIYRFREAEVGLYLRARREGVGNVHLVPLTLRVNFRSQRGIVDWVNHTFAHVLPQHEDIAAGAVSYAPSEAFHPAAGGEAVSLHALPESLAGAEAQRVAEIIHDARRADPKCSVAILVRSRSHLAEIVPQLKRAALRFRAIEIEHLGDRQTVQDLLALTRALTHPADRVAWLASLRAPWCGLDLSDLHALVTDAPTAAVWDLLQDDGRIARLSRDGQVSVQRLRAVLGDALARRRRRSLRDWVEGTWLALGGPACVEDETGLEDARVFLALLEELEVSGDLTDFAALAEGVERLFALPDVGADAGLQLMTIHKAKGLEFDVVIVPGLGRTPPPPSSHLLIWQEIPRGHDRTDLLLAPIRESGQQDDAIYRFLRRIDDTRARHEDGRVLYVAATRARQRLHLLAQVRRTDDADTAVRAPRACSLLNHLWPLVEQEFERAAQAFAPPAEGAAPGSVYAVLAAQGIRRLPAAWRLPEPPSAVTWLDAGPAVDEPRDTVEFSWAGETARHVGSAVHQWLLRIARDGPQAWTAQRIDQQQASMRAALGQLGVTPDQASQAVQRVCESLKNTLGDSRGRWILDPAHAGGHSEYALSGVFAGSLRNIIIDRTFIDDQDVRWIVDYKTSVHAGGGIREFLARERERYQPQLEVYASIMATLDSRPIRLGLYFPLLQEWIEWPAAG